MPLILNALIILSLLAIAAVFGIFYGWVTTVMWGLDAADPRIAIAAMQDMNATIRNMPFGIVFFGTPVMLAVTAGALMAAQRGSAAALVGLGALVYTLGCLTVTMAINVPMNEALAQVVIPQDTAQATQIWQAYTGDWQFWNLMRTIACGVALVLVGCAALGLRASRSPETASRQALSLA